MKKAFITLLSPPSREEDLTPLSCSLTDLINGF
jgi:hypothetical protein